MIEIENHTTFSLANKTCGSIIDEYSIFEFDDASFTFAARMVELFYTLKMNKEQ